MKISGFQKLTLLDYPGKLAALVFTPGCMWRCGYCHNPELVLPQRMCGMNFIEEEVIFDYLKKRRGLLDGVVISGGEPTLQPDLRSFIMRIKSMGFLIKLDTNGVNPDALSFLINEKLVDYFAMDIKSSFQRYSAITSRAIKAAAIRKSVKLIINSGIDYEFRTTILPRFHDICELKRIGRMIKGAKNYYLQRFRAGNTLNPVFRFERTYNEEDLEIMAETMRPYVSYVGVRA